MISTGLFIFLLFTFDSQCKEDGDTEYVLNFASPVYVCPDEVSQSWIDTSKIEVKRHNESTAFMTGSVSFLKGIEDQTMVEVFIEKDVSGQYQLQLSHEICDLCSEIENPDSPYHDYLKYIGLPDKCPFQSNEYEINNLMLDTSDLPINDANAGTYLVTVNFYRNANRDCKTNKKFISCLKLDTVIEAV